MRNPNEKLYVEMIRFSGTHKYLAGFSDTFEEASTLAEAEFEERGGKYGYEIYEPHIYYKGGRKEVVELKYKKLSNYEN